MEKFPFRPGKLRLVSVFICLWPLFLGYFFCLWVFLFLPPLLWQRFSWCLHIRSLYRPKFWVTKPKSQQSGAANEKAEIPFACFIGIAFLLSEHQMGFVCRGSDRRTYVSESVSRYLCVASCCVTVQWCVKHTSTSTSTAPEPNW